MQSIISLLTNDIFFWMAWVIIPLIMEIIPGFLGIFIYHHCDSAYLLHFEKTDSLE